MIIWRNAGCHDWETGVTDAPPGLVEITRIEERESSTHIWFAPVAASPASPAGDMPPDPVGMLTAMAGMHHEWFQAWQAAGFTEEQAFGLVREVVSAAFTRG